MAQATSSTLAQPASPLAQLCTALNRSPLIISKLQAAFGLPVLKQGYPRAYLACLQTIVYLRTFGISEERLLKLWHLEKKLLELLKADTTGSPTWFLDSCGLTSHRNRRLLLTNYDTGVLLPAGALQLGLDFATRPAQLFTGPEMGEDAIRVLEQILTLTHKIRADIATELPHLRSAAKWAAGAARRG
jgi:hypothetical protein